MTDTATRSADLALMLRERRRELQDELRGRIRHGLTDRPKDVGDSLEDSEADIQGDIELALTQLRAETLARIDAALVRIDQGLYGACAQCAGDISERRLRALPFAVRCQACEQRREQDRGYARRRAEQRGTFTLFPDGVSP